MIEMKGICKTYRVRRREAGLGNAVRSLFSRDCTEIPALRDMSFTVPDGQILATSAPTAREKAPPSKFSAAFSAPTEEPAPWTA